ncbi:RIC1 domain-containing protein [Meloidogyne graminicola]|uniref:RIC1 domain-containing protein n=1 Tax=Meloidogyne graminicola TaxID=189291 RepID=A0A8S9ZFA6_9BILA|nr:RIC1 domain-containing protein [Meloidogyne graminicola]
MILPEGCDYRIELNSPQSINSLVSNRDHSIFVVSTDTFLYFYLADTHLLACIYQKDDDDTAERGFFRDVYWKPDSTAIAVTTSKNFVNIYNVEVSSESSFNLHDPVGDGTDFTRESTELFMNKSRPRINVNLVVVARLESTPTCILTFKEEFIVCLKDGWLHRLSWSGSILHDLSFNIRSVHHDQANPTKNSLQGLDYFVSDIAPFLGGICIVYSDGRAALIVSSILEFRPGSISILFAGGLNDACCCSTNFKFRLLYFGCTNGDIAAYSPNDVDGGLMQLFRVRLFAKDCTEQLSHISSVRQINCLSPSGCAFAVLWNSKVSAEQKYTCTHLENNSFKFSKTNDCHLSCSTVLAIFSPFGEQWWCSLEDKTVASVNINESHPFGNYEYTSMDWSLEGYQLWLGTSNANLHFINMVKSIQGMHDALVLVGSDRIFVCPTNQHSQFSSAPHLIWQLIKPPHGYINTNGPIKHASISRQYTSNKILVIGGSHGFCFCNLKNTKWRMFRKEAQEKSLFLTGGINLFESFILCSAYNLDSKDERLYIFRLEDQLDTDLAHFISTNRILQMKICGSFLLMFGVDSMISIYSLSVQSKINGLQIECIAEIRIAEFLHHPNFSLISMELARLNFHSDAMPFCGDFDSLLINASGHLLLLSPMLQNLNGHHKEISNDNIMEFQLHPPTLVASLVEEFWIVHPLNFTYDIEQYSCRIPYLSNALWINAGSRKCRVLWLPLSINAQNENISTDVSTPQNSRAFISRRIMIPFNLEIYPLCIFFIPFRTYF